jgi:cellulose synthase/poly-beta-1,6-N-acetylglucosamine synthase-like glycosyltransferase
MGGRSGFGAALRLILLALAVSGLFFWLLFGDDPRPVLLRAVVVSLLLFLAVLLIRYFSLLWLAVLQHLERSLTGGGPAGDGAGEMGWPGVSILVPAFNEARVLDRALESLVRLDYPEYEIVVIDDGSTDATLEVAKEWEGRAAGVEVRVVTRRNGGKARALNLGIEVSRHPFVMAMDADSRIEPRTLKAAIPHFRDPIVGAVAGNVKVENRVSLLTWLQALEYVEGLNMPRRAQGFLATVNIVPGPVGVFRREALEEVGGYDTDTFAEDADLTLKLVTRGWKVYYEEEAVAWTLAPESWLDLVQQRYRWTRGLLQAVGKRKGVLLRPVPDFPLWLSTLEMAFEGFIWPVMNVYGHLFFGIVALVYGFVEPLLWWWLLLTTMDFVLALVTVAMEEEDLRMVPLALIYRFFYLLWLDVSKVFAALEEAGGFEMGWGKLRRTDRPAPGTT